MNGADYIRRYVEPEISEFGVAVADFLDAFYGGIHHLATTTLRKMEWKAQDYIAMCVYGGLSTCDFDELTRLVILAHDRCIRVEVEAAAPKYLRLIFYKRRREPSAPARHHPTLEEAVTRIRAGIARHKGNGGAAEQGGTAEAQPPPVAAQGAEGAGCAERAERIEEAYAACRQEVDALRGRLSVLEQYARAAENGIAAFARYGESVGYLSLADTIAATMRKMKRLEALVFDACRRWADAPPWASWWAVNPDGAALWYAQKPAAAQTGWRLAGPLEYADDNMEYAGECPLDALGLDWRDSLTAKPEAQP